MPNFGLLRPRISQLMVRIRDLQWISRANCTLDGCPTHRLAIFSQIEICLKIYILKEQKAKYKRLSSAHVDDVGWKACGWLRLSKTNPIQGGHTKSLWCHPAWRVSTRKHFIIALAGAAVFNLIKLNATWEPQTCPQPKMKIISLNLMGSRLGKQSHR